MYHSKDADLCCQTLAHVGESGNGFLCLLFLHVLVLLCSSKTHPKLVL